MNVFSIAIDTKKITANSVENCNLHNKLTKMLNYVNINVYLTPLNVFHVDSAIKALFN